MVNTNVGKPTDMPNMADEEDVLGTVLNYILTQQFNLNQGLKIYGK